MWKKVLFTFIAAAVVIFALFAAGVIAAYIKAAPAVIPESAEVFPAEKIIPGAENSCTFDVMLPADTIVKSAEIFRNGSLLSAGKAEFAGWYFNKMKWRISGKFRIFEPGKTDGLSVTVRTEKFFGKNPPEFQVKLPEMECAVPENIQSGAKLHLAPVPLANELDGIEKSFAEPFYKNRIFYAVLAIIFILCALAVIFFKRKNNESSLPLDQRTLREIEQICAMVRAKKIRVESGFAMGRNSDMCEIVLDTNDMNVSRCHCRFQFKNQQWMMKNESSNGTYVDGTLLEKGEVTSLKSGTLLKVGKSTFVFLASLK